MSLNLKGLDDLQKKLDSVSGEVSFNELFTESFMITYTNFANINELFKNSGFKLDSQDDLASIPESELDDYLKTVTQFDSWHDMKQTAGTLYIKSKLGLK